MIPYTVSVMIPFFYKYIHRDLNQLSNFYTKKKKLEVKKYDNVSVFM